MSLLSLRPEVISLWPEVKGEVISLGLEYLTLFFNTRVDAVGEVLSQSTSTVVVTLDLPVSRSLVAVIVPSEQWV